ncbi:hypothetical protein BKA67DRAFT_577285 [Truncatella angustata]|uniref:Uncharacterized protein n=1 Tax=Truncatella angustata TaxID=152316 RepID=A0A9P8RJU3_9PEZI|nr:uncharacterized protein BKA67DRAFT_577285 [Truncatella angustata]KAH6647381.1 hypothetical protein BKA67DRAFT_577285 [Truncatella angustata]
MNTGISLLLVMFRLPKSYHEIASHLGLLVSLASDAAQLLMGTMIPGEPLYTATGDQSTQTATIAML